MYDPLTETHCRQDLRSIQARAREKLANRVKIYHALHCTYLTYAAKENKFKFASIHSTNCRKFLERNKHADIDLSPVS